MRGKPEGIGWWYYENGDVFLGFWKAGERHGFGTMWYTDNTVYVGYFSDGKKQGLGLLVLGEYNYYNILHNNIQFVGHPLGRVPLLPNS